MRYGHAIAQRLRKLGHYVALTTTNELPQKMIKISIRNVLKRLIGLLVMLG